MVVRNLFTFYVLPDQTPTGGKSQNTGILGHFGLRRPLAAWRNPGAGPKTEKCNSPVLGALLGGESGRPKSFSPKVRNLLHFTFWPTGPPRAGNRELREGFLRPFWPRRALGTERNSGRNRKTQTATLRPEREKQTPSSSVPIPSLD